MQNLTTIFYMQTKKRLVLKYQYYKKGFFGAFYKGILTVELYAMLQSYYL